MDNGRYVPIINTIRINCIDNCALVYILLTMKEILDLNTKITLVNMS